MALAYIMLYHDFLDEVEMLTDAEVGRLVRAMLGHARGAPAPEALLTGNERFLYPRWRLQVDREAAAYDRRCEINRRNGRMGGRPPRSAPPAPDVAAPPPASKPASPPTQDAVRDFCAEKRLATDPERFFQHYQSNGWTSAGRPIADWKAKLMEWDARDRAAPSADPVNPALNYAQREYRDEDFGDDFFCNGARFADLLSKPAPGGSAP